MSATILLSPRRNNLHERLLQTPKHIGRTALSKPSMLSARIAVLRTASEFSSGEPPVTPSQDQ